MRWEISPYERVGPLRFGMSESEVRELLGPSSVVTHGESRQLYYGGRVGGVKVSVNPQGVQMVEFHAIGDEPDPAARRVPVVGDLELVGEFGQVAAALRARGYDLREGNAHLVGGMQQYMCDELGLTLLHESEELTSVEFVSVCGKDEYERLVEMQRRYRRERDERYEKGL